LLRKPAVVDQAVNSRTVYGPAWWFTYTRSTWR